MKTNRILFVTGYLCSKEMYNLYNNKLDKYLKPKYYYWWNDKNISLKRANEIINNYDNILCHSAGCQLVLLCFLKFGIKKKFNIVGLDGHLISLDELVDIDKINIKKIINKTLESTSPPPLKIRNFVKKLTKNLKINDYNRYRDWIYLLIKEERKYANYKKTPKIKNNENVKWTEIQFTKICNIKPYASHIDNIFNWCDLFCFRLKCSIKNTNICWFPMANHYYIIEHSNLLIPYIYTLIRNKRIKNTTRIPKSYLHGLNQRVAIKKKNVEINNLLVKFYKINISTNPLISRVLIPNGCQTIYWKHAWEIEVKVVMGKGLYFQSPAKKITIIRKGNIIKLDGWLCHFFFAGTKKLILDVKPILGPFKKVVDKTKFRKFCY